MANLVIVESPAKAKTIKKYLGAGYNVVASMGHVRDLPRAQLAIDVDNGFKPRYINIPGKSKLIKQLKEMAAESDTVYLATDPDREGEAISWHLAHILKLDTDDDIRVTFGEITKKGIEQGMAGKRKLDMDLVDAQQARRVLDRLVGYKLSPFLWKKVKSGLSAGRVQSVAVKLIVDRHRQIEAFIPQEYWNIDAHLSTTGSVRRFKAAYQGTDGKKVTVENEAQAKKIKEESLAEKFVIDKITKGERRRVPAPPFTTSSLQQEASRKLGFTARRTMRAAQALYEGVEVAGYGVTGLITYMRTDSIRISDEAYFAAKNFISEKYGDKYAPPYRRNFKARSGAQDAHEAIRPTNISLTPQQAARSLSGDNLKLYKLVWERFVASQMSDSLQETVSVDISAGRHNYRANGYTVVFDGFTTLYEESTDDKKTKERALPPMDENTGLKVREIETEQKFTQPPAEYNEASLIKAMEENGIGRPSTYAPIISTIIDRGYVEREAKKLVPTQLGIAITDILADQFPDIVDTAFTARMESDLDSIEEGNKDWTKVMEDFYGIFRAELSKAERNMDGQKVRIPDQMTDEICEICGRPMVIKTGRYGKFLACSGFPECKNTKKYVVYAKGRCPVCGGRIRRLTSKRGRVFYACENSQSCHFMSWEEPTDQLCPVCGSTMFKKSAKGAKAHCIKPGCPNNTGERSGQAEGRGKAAKTTSKSAGTKTTTRRRKSADIEKENGES